MPGFVAAHGILTVACGVYFPDQRANLSPPVLESQSLNCWATREVLGIHL